MFRHRGRPAAAQPRSITCAQAVELLGEIETLFAGAGEGAGFPDYIADVRRRHKPKRNLTRLLGSRGW